MILQANIQNQEIENFTKAIIDFKVRSINLSEKTQKKIKHLAETFNQEVKLKHPRDIYHLYQAINYITYKIAKKSIDELKNPWLEVLKTLKNRKIHKIGMGYSYFKISVAEKILSDIGSFEKNVANLVVEEMNITNENNRNEVVNFIYKTDREAFGTCFQKGFLRELLKSKKVKCFVVRNQNKKIIGTLWGFFTQYQNQDIFHIWELSRKPSMARMGIGMKLIRIFPGNLKNQYPNLKFASLFVEKNNSQARKIYNNENFTPLVENNEAEKIFMKLQLAKDALPLNPSVSKKIVRTFVFTVPWYKLIFYEIARQCEILWRKFRYY